MLSLQEHGLTVKFYYKKNVAATLWKYRNIKGLRNGFPVIKNVWNIISLFDKHRTLCLFRDIDKAFSARGQLNISKPVCQNATRKAKNILVPPTDSAR